MYFARKFLAVLSMAVAGTAAADVYVAFQSPTGNIHCGIHEKAGTLAVCDMREFSASYSAPSCDYPGMSRMFAVSESRESFLGCYEDGSQIRADNPVLDYGESVSLGGISCVSSKPGITCTNAEGRGFHVARAKQRLF